jgi:hypothetical protein
MNKLALTIAIIVSAATLQVTSAFAALPGGCTGDPHDQDSGPTGDPHDPSGSTSSGFETANPHDSIKSHLGEGDQCPGS